MEINIEALLGRDPIQVDEIGISKLLKNKTILITGACGSIGSVLVKQIAKFYPKQIVLFDHNENNMFFFEKEYNKLFPDLKIIPRLGSICDVERVNAVFEETQPDIVYHAAANKHVPLSEVNPREAVNDNVLGTHVMLNAAEAYHCESFIMISTDKAVKPTSIMGSTKRTAELLVQLKSQSNVNTNFVTRFIVVRFGNVLGSSGSVVPIFKSQIECGGPITVTHPDMTRFFMTIPEATQLVLQANVIGKGGEIFVLDMGESVKIIDLAHNMIKQYNLIPDVDIKINFSGIRPGEKIYEELFLDSESVTQTNHPKIRISKSKPVQLDTLDKILQLEQLPADATLSDIRKEFLKIIPEAQY